MLATLNAIAPIFLVIMVGYALRRTKIVRDDMWSAVEHICFYLLFPFLIIRTLARTSLADIPIFNLSVVTTTAVIGMAALLLALRPLSAQRFGISGPTFTSLFQGATRWHGFMALVIAGSLYGDQGVALCAIAIGVMVPVIQVLNVSVLAVYGQSETTVGWRNVLIRVGRNPLILACLAGFLFNLTGLPDFIFGAFNIVGDGGLGLALLTVGAGLRLDRAMETKSLVALGVLIRLIGMPLIMLLMSWIVGLTGLPRTIAVIAGAVPTASTAYVMARQMGGDAELMANIMTFQVLVAALTLPMFIFVAEHL